MLARDGEDKPPLPAHSLNWYQDGLSSKLLEMDAISTASPDHQFKGKTGKLLDWQLFPFPLQNTPAPDHQLGIPLQVFTQS